MSLDIGSVLICTDSNIISHGYSSVWPWYNTTVPIMEGIADFAVKIELADDLADGDFSSVQQVGLFIFCFLFLFYFIRCHGQRTDLTTLDGYTC